MASILELDRADQEFNAIMTGVEVVFLVTGLAEFSAAYRAFNLAGTATKYAARAKLIIAAADVTTGIGGLACRNSDDPVCQIYKAIEPYVLLGVFTGNVGGRFINTSLRRLDLLSTAKVHQLGKLEELFRSSDKLRTAQIDAFYGLIKGNDISDLVKLNSDLNKFSSFADAIVRVPRRMEAWSFVRSAIKNTGNTGFTQLAVDFKTLDKVLELSTDGAAFRRRFPGNWEEVLSDILTRQL